MANAILSAEVKTVPEDTELAANEELDFTDELACVDDNETVDERDETEETSTLDEATAKAEDELTLWPPTQPTSGPRGIAINKALKKRALGKKTRGSVINRDITRRSLIV